MKRFLSLSNSAVRDKGAGGGLSVFDLRIPPDEKEKGNFTNSRAIIDACRPFHWKDDFPPVNSPSPETMREAQEKWGYLCE